MFAKIARPIVLAVAFYCGSLAVADAAIRRAAPAVFVAGSLVREPAIDERGHLLVPIRGVFEALHAVVSYTPPRIVVVRKSGVVLAGLVVDRQHAIVNNRPRSLAIAPVRRGGRIYVPLRFVAELAGAGVTYSAVLRRVDLQLSPAEFGVQPSEPVAPPDTGRPLWAISVVGLLLTLLAAECLRRAVLALGIKRTPRYALARSGRRNANEFAHAVRTCDEHRVGQITE